jgi:hypothetical protein
MNSLSTYKKRVFGGSKAPSKKALRTYLTKKGLKTYRSILSQGLV